MKKKERASLRAKTQTELKKSVEEKKIELAKFSANFNSAKDKNLKKAKNLKIEIAQILTLIREKVLLENESKK